MADKLKGYAKVVVNDKEVYEGSCLIYSTMRNESEILNRHQVALADFESIIAQRRRGLLTKKEYNARRREIEDSYFN